MPKTTPEVTQNTPTPWFMKVNYRAVYYRVITPIGLLIAFYGVMREQEWALWVSLLNQLIGGGALPILNTPTREVAPVSGEEGPPRLF